MLAPAHDYFQKVRAQRSFIQKQNQVCVFNQFGGCGIVVNLFALKFFPGVVDAGKMNTPYLGNKGDELQIAVFVADDSDSDHTAK